MQQDFAKYAEEIRDGLMPNNQPIPLTPAPESEGKPREVKTANMFGDDDTQFLWYPYMPIGDYTVLMADGGTGKTVLCCGIAAAISTGKPLPGEVFENQPQNVLIISAEDSGEILKKRLKLSGADLSRVFVLDRTDSIGMDFTSNYAEFEATVKSCSPALVVVDPWHGFLGECINMNRTNSLRPALQKMAGIAKQCNCAIILVSHVNKRAQGENANNAATGSADFINAARSAMRVIFDEEDEDGRIMVHTKVNYAAYGQSVKYRIVEGGVEWTGFSNITKQTMELAARRNTTVGTIMGQADERESLNTALIAALEIEAEQFDSVGLTYSEFEGKYGNLFGNRQPKRALDAVRERLNNDGYCIQTGIQIKKNGVKGNGFRLKKISNLSDSGT